MRRMSYASRMRVEAEAVGLARANLRDLARGVEEQAILLEGHGIRSIPGELVKVSERLIEIREALESVAGQSK